MSSLARFLSADARTKPRESHTASELALKDAGSELALKDHLAGEVFLTTYYTELHQSSPLN